MKKARLQSLISTLIFWVDIMGFKGKAQFSRLVCFILPQIKELNQSEFKTVLEGINFVWVKSDIKRLEKLYNDHGKK